MKKKRYLVGLAGVALLAGLLGGCKSSTEPVQDKYAVFQDLISSNELFAEDTTMLGGGNSSPNAQVLGKTASPILPVVWGRRITQFSRTVDFQDQNDTVVVATITYSISGNVIIAAIDSIGDTTATILTKPFSETTSRNVKFVRIDRTSIPRNNWRMREISAVKGGTTNSLLVINQMEAILGQDTVIVTDPNDYYFRLPPFLGRTIPEITTSTPTTVRLTVTSTDPDTDFVMLHRPFALLGSVLHPLHTRMTMVSEVNNGDGTYTRVYEKSWDTHISGWHHFFVSGITRSSLFDDSASWATVLWGFPYRVQ